MFRAYQHRSLHYSPRNVRRRTKKITPQKVLFEVIEDNYSHFRTREANIIYQVRSRPSIISLMISLDVTGPETGYRREEMHAFIHDSTVCTRVCTHEYIFGFLSHRWCRDTHWLGHSGAHIAGGGRPSPGETWCILRSDRPRLHSTLGRGTCVQGGQ